MLKHTGRCRLASSIQPRTRWILCEQAARWGRAFRVAMSQESRFKRLERLLIETRTLGACQSMLDRFPASYFTLEVTRDGFNQQLGFAAMIAKEYADTRLSVVSSCDDGPAFWHDRELAFREAGAITAARSIWNINRILDGALCHMAHVPIEKMPLEQRIWAELPWPEVLDRE
ncbi:MAG: hypothetical protein JW829_08215 [Pirellulales bacterium]|nr:hypothetical protein [Pirellulales bacterium]